MNSIKQMRVFVLKHYKDLLKLAIAFMLIALILIESKTQGQSIHLASVLHTIRVIPIQWIALFTIGGLIASMSMVFYDILGMKSLKYEIEKRELFCISFVSHSLNTLLGFGGLTGASIKKLLLKKHPIEIEEMTAYQTLLGTASITGLSFFALLTWFNFHSISPLISQHKWLLLSLIGFSFYLIAYFFLDRIVKPFKTWTATFGASKLFLLRFQLFIVSIGEWGLAGVLFCTLVSYFHKDLAYVNVLSIFVIASMAGILSFIPGGIGSFDLIAVMGLQIIGLTSNQAVTVIILYRIFYYFIPSGVAITLFSLQSLNRTEQNGPAIKSEAYGQLIATIMAIIVIMCGLVLLISGLTPGLIARSKLIADLTSITFLQFSRSISIAIGLMLMITAKEIFLRVKRAYYVTMILLLVGGIFTFTKGLDIEELIFILISMGIMRLSKTNFYRKSILMKPSHLTASILGVLVLLIGYLKTSHILFLNYIKTFGYPHHVFHGLHAFIHSGVITYTLFLLFTITWYVNRPQIEQDARFEGVDEERLELFFKSHKGHHLSHLIYLGDKNLFWAVQGQVLIAYSKYSDKVVVLGDAMGEKSLIAEGIQEFQKFIDLYGYRAVFYEVDEENLSMYHDNGYYFFKLGEEAIVDLQTFEMLGSNRRAFRNTVNRFAKDGFAFDVLFPPYRDDFLEELEQISSEWLGKRNEMGFCVGWFDKAYLQKSPVAIVTNLSKNEIIAFVSLTYRNQEKEYIGIDLMRFKSDVPNSTMDFIFIQSLIYFKENGYRYFSFSVAPLSQVGATPNSHMAEKVAHFVYKHGKLIYSFEGLRKFKNKFDPAWKPMYLAYPQLMSLPALLIEISMLVNKSKEHTIKCSENHRIS